MYLTPASFTMRQPQYNYLEVAGPTLFFKRLTKSEDPFGVPTVENFETTRSAVTKKTGASMKIALPPNFIILVSWRI